jgi:predicted trehalose synthase
LQVDENGLGWEQAWSITRRTFACACHTLLLDKVVDEVLYEARNRPNWLVIPLESLAEI